MDSTMTPPTTTSNQNAPAFAVVGRVNEGKSSVVAALTEDEDVLIGPEPGTTTATARHPIMVGDETLVTIFDTPGFQEPEATLEWLKEWLAAHGSSAAQRPAAVAAFLEKFKGQGRFTDETALLEPITAGAAIIYVVDASHPFRASYECEMEILQWTGKPRIALLNRSADADFSPAWKAALRQYFSHVQPFNAHANLFEERIDLLTLLSHLVEEQRPTLKHAAQVLLARDESRTLEAARMIAATAVDMTTFTLTEPGTGSGLDGKRRQALEERFAEGLRGIEARSRDQIEELYAYHRLDRESGEGATRLTPHDLFSGDVWRFLGLSSTQLIATGATGGALVGGMIDAAVAGHSFLLGTLIGAGIGGVGAAYTALREPEAKLFGITLAGPEIIVGPHGDPRFPWIVLDRALLHQEAVARRPHSVRVPLTIENEGSDSQDTARRGLIGKLDTLTTGKMKRALDRARKTRSEKNMAALAAILTEVIRERRSSRN